MIQGSCLCGAVRWQFEGQPDGATACNCTACRRYGVLWAYDYEDEGIKVAGKDLILSQPLIVFVENFLKFPVGTPMPMGYFDNDKSAWIAADNGLVIQLLPPKGDLAQIDVDGTGKAIRDAKSSIRANEFAEPFPITLIESLDVEMQKPRQLWIHFAV